MKNKEQIIRYLRRKGVLNLFYKNYYSRRNWVWASETIDGQFADGADVINNAFRWSDTIEGHSFWREINDEFLDWYVLN